MDGPPTEATATETARYPMGERIRAIAQGPDGALWVLEDVPTGRLRKLVPRETTR